MDPIEWVAQPGKVILSNWCRPVFDCWNDKLEWLDTECKQWLFSNGVVGFTTTRESLILEDTLKITGGFTPDQLQSLWKPKMGNEQPEPCKDQWYQAVLAMLLDQDFGLFVQGANISSRLEVNPDSESVVENHFECFRLVGRLLDKHLVRDNFRVMDRSQRFAKYYCKILLAWPLDVVADAAEESWLGQQGDNWKEVLAMPTEDIEML